MAIDEFTWQVKGLWFLRLRGDKNPWEGWATKADCCKSQICSSGSRGNPLWQPKEALISSHFQTATIITYFKTLRMILSTHLTFCCTWSGFNQSTKIAKAVLPQQIKLICGKNPSTTMLVGRIAESLQIHTLQHITAANQDFKGPLNQHTTKYVPLFSAHTWAVL